MADNTGTSSSAAEATVLGCVHCDFRCCSTNQLCRHLCETRHGISKCPQCDTYIVARAFLTSIQKILARNAQTRASNSHASSSDGLANSNETQRGGDARPLFTVVTSTHKHVAGLLASSSAAESTGGFRVYEKEDFVLPGVPSDYNLEPVTAHAAPTRHFRCMQCQASLPTWTQVTKHFDVTQHTLPLCVVCRAPLKSYGPQCPTKHEASSGHRGFWGVFFLRDDYDSGMQAPGNCYTAATAFTGLRHAQYRCVCGISFVQPLHLAEHLRRAHGVTAVPDAATCRLCGAQGTLAAMVEHLVGHPPPDAPPDPEIPRGDPVSMDFDAAPFRVHRPLFAAAASGDEGSAATPADNATDSASSRFAIFYQCPDCQVLFENWERMTEHLDSSGHCPCYCPVCAAAVDVPQDPRAGDDRGATLAAHLQHLCNHPGLLGTPALPDRLEVLADMSDPAVAALLERAQPRGNSAKETSELRQRVFQCPDEASGCTRVFGTYGELCAHLTESGHYEARAGDATPPFVQCRVLFTSAELCAHFGFKRCRHCSLAFDPLFLPIHESLCITGVKKRAHQQRQ